MPSNSIPNLEISLGAQKSVWGAFCAYRKINKSDFNVAVSLIVPVVILALSFDNVSEKALLSYKAVNSLSELFFRYSVGVTGFLIAGVSILVSVNDKDLFIIMAKSKYKQIDDSYSKYSQFQFIFFSLIVALSYHLTLLSVSLCLKFFTSEGAFLGFWFASFIKSSNSALYVINCFVLCALAWMFTRCLLLVKSVIWNVYQMIVLTILWADHVQNRDNHIN